MKPLLLHIGGRIAKRGWTIVNSQPAPEVDILADCRTIPGIVAGSVDAIYASHVLEHLPYMAEAGKALSEWRRLLKPGGVVMVAVPDLQTVCSLYSQGTLKERAYLLRVIYGGQMTPDDTHFGG